MKTKPNKADGNGKKVVIWGRYSSAEQGEGDSRRRQETANRALAIREGYQIVKEYFDEGTSVKDSATPMFKAMLEKLPKDVGIVCENLDRINRGHPWRAKAFIADILEAGHFIHTSQSGNERLYTAESIGELDTLVIGDLTQTLAWSENSKRTKRVKEAMDANVELARQGKPAPLGAWLPSYIRYNPETQKYVIVEEKRAVFQRIFQEYASGRGTVAITKGLIKDGIPPLRFSSKTTLKSGKKDVSWGANTVRRILGHEYVIGTLVVNGERIPKAFPPAIKEGLFYKVQAMLAKNADRGGNYSGENVRNIFRGVMKCAHCGLAMKVKKNEYLTCRGKEIGRCDESHSVKYHPMEWQFLQWFVPEATEALLGKDQSFSRIESLAAKKNVLEAKIEQTLGLLDEGLPVDKVKQRLQTLESERTAVDGELAKAKADNATKASLPQTMDTLNKLVDSALNDQAVRAKVAALVPTIVRNIKVNTEDKKKPSFRVDLLNGDVLKWSFAPLGDRYTIVRRDQKSKLDGKGHGHSCKRTTQPNRIFVRTK